MLRFIEQKDAYSVYKRADGRKVYLAHGFPRRYLVDFSEDWMREQWREWVRALAPWEWPNRDGFLDSLRTRVTDPDAICDVQFCEWCALPTDIEKNGSGVAGGGFACDQCVADHYTFCNDCNEHHQDHRTASTLNDEAVCDSCLDRNYYYCETCSGYYYHTDADDHSHDDDDDDESSSCCESPALNFAIRNDGEGMLQNDERVTVTLPAGTLDDEGLSRIRWYLREQDLWAASRIIDDLDRRWQTREGNFTKRLSRTLYNRFGEKIPAPVLSQVGTIAREHSTSTEFTVAVTRNLNMSARDFCHADSCWWQSYSASRCALKTNGGFGLRSFNEEGSVSGRAWVMPLKMTAGYLKPTFNTETPDAFVVFNGYGNLGGYVPARILSHMAGMTYRKIEFSCDPMYINAGGYLVAPEEIATNYTDGSLCLNVQQHSNLFYTEHVAAKEPVNA